MRIRAGRGSAHWSACGCWWSTTRCAWPRPSAGASTAEGFEVEVSHDGLDGLWRAKERDYGAIVLDLLLPGMNGYQVCRTLRAAEVWTPILMLTAKSGEYDEAEALDTGADDFLSKPFSFVVLVARLRAIARRGRGAAAGGPRRRRPRGRSRPGAR